MDAQEGEKKQKVYKDLTYLTNITFVENFSNISTTLAQDKLNSLNVCYKLNSIETRMHNSTKNMPEHALSFQDTKQIADFIINFPEVNAIMLPGCCPGDWSSSNITYKVLSTNLLKTKVCDEYYALALCAHNNECYEQNNIQPFCGCSLYPSFSQCIQ